MNRINKNDLNGIITTVAELLDIDLLQTQFDKTAETVNFDAVNNITIRRSFISNSPIGDITFSKYRNGSIDTFTLNVENSSSKINVEANEIYVGNKSIPRINIRIESDDMEESFVELNATSFSMQAAIGKVIDEEQYYRFASYDDPSYEESCALPHIAPYDLRKYKAGEDHKTKYGIEKRSVSLNPTLLEPELVYQVYGGNHKHQETTVIKGREYLEDVIGALLSNKRNVALFNYVFDKVDQFIPGVTDFLSKEYEFFRDTTDKMFTTKGTVSEFLVGSVFIDIASPVLDTKKEKGTQKKVTDV